MAETLKEKTAKGLFWGGLNNGIQQVLNIVFGIFLARMLGQKDYGMIGMIIIFSSLSCALQEGGFISALIRRKNVTKRDYVSVFWTSSLMGFFFYCILFFAAPLIAAFYVIPELVPLSRFYFLGFFLSSLNVAPRAYLFRNMMVRENAIIGIVSLIVSGIIGIIMAANGFSYWGIAVQGNVYSLMITVLSFYFAGWYPSLSIDFTPVKEMFSFSSKLIITNIFNIINGNIFSVLLGKMYSVHEVGNYTQANKWNNMGSSFVSGMLGGIAQPVFSKTEGDKERQKKVFRKLMRFAALISFPAMFGLAFVSNEFIVILLTEKWLKSAQMMQMLCVAGAFSSISGLFANLIISRGHSNIYMWCTISICITQLLGAFVSAPYGIRCMIQLYVIITIVWIFVWHFFAKKEINLRLFEVLSDIMPYLILSIFFIGVASFLSDSINNIYLRFIFKVLFVAVSYSLSLWLLNSTIAKEMLLFITKREIKI